MSDDSNCELCRLSFFFISTSLQFQQMLDDAQSEIDALRSEVGFTENCSD